ncbi:MAG TPA: hypothetical protein VK084_06150 [Chitinophagaceae bacterium]|nr:hypothetical protein [Chitinophagaceae bacterium]
MNRRLYISIFTTLLFFGSIAITAPGSAQVAKEVEASFKEAQHPAFQITYEYPKDIVKEALEQKLEADQIDTKRKHRIITAKGCVYPQLSKEKLDFYFQIEKEKRKVTTLTLFISKGYTNFISSKTNPHIAQNALTYLNRFKSNVQYYDLQEKIDEKKEDIEKVKKDAKKLSENKDKLLSKLKEQKDIPKTATEKETKKANKKIKKYNRKLNRTRKKMQKTEEKRQELNTTLKVLNSKQASLHL